MKKVLKWLGGILGVLVVVVGVFVVNLIWFKPFFINHFFERVFLRFAIESPEILTSTRILKPIGLRFYHDDLADQSDEATLAQLMRLKENYETLQSYDDEGLSGQKLLSKRILNAFLEPQIALIEFRLHNYPINQLFGYQNTWPSFMVDQHWIENVDDAESYIARLDKVSIAFDQLMDGVELRASKGITPPTFVIDKVLLNVRSFIEAEPAKNTLYTSFVQKLDDADVQGNTRDDLLTRVEAAIEDSVYGAYRKLDAFLVALRPRTTTDDGVWKLPDGDRYYDLVLWQNTTTRKSADEIHQHGLSEVDRIQQEMLTILEGEGYDTGEGFTSAMAALTADTSHYFADTTEGRAEILERYREIIREIDGKLEPWFDRKHQAEVEVKRVPEFREETAPGAYYQGPSLDGAEPGRFFANLYDVKATPRWGMGTLAYHEAVPGHHLQIAIRSELEGIPTFRKLIPFTAFAEGWALYAERLAWEMGLEEEPLDNLGRLQAELFRAVRLVVDTGIHRFKWTREKAMDYMKTNLGSADSDVEAEIERYIVNPGQATAYKVGMDFMLEQRAKAKNALGDQFDIREFHNAVLENGSVPLSILSSQIDAYIASKSASSEAS